MKPRLRIGISTCPNDTFAFFGLLTGRVSLPGIDLEFVLSDVQDLNQRLSEGALDVAKVSFAAVLDRGEDYWVLPAGAALGFGVGPVLLAARPGEIPRDTSPPPRVLAPGRQTTAALLWRLLYGRLGEPEHVVFSEIMPALLRGEADFGVCIHEGRFTYAARGLHLAEDLGRTYEQRTGAPIPLGGIVATKRLQIPWLRALTQGIRQSILAAESHTAEALATMRAHAAELDDLAIWKHVELYVNAWTRDLGPLGTKALETLYREAASAHLLQGSTPISVLPGDQDHA